MSRATVLFIALLATGPLQAEQIFNKLKFRTWTDSTGAFKVQAQLVNINGNSITLKREDNSASVTLKMDNLSKDDLAYIAMVRKQIALQDSADSLEAFCNRSSKWRELYSQVPKAGETTIQAQTRKSEAIAKIKETTMGQMFSIVAQVEDVKQAEIQRDFLDSLSMGVFPQKYAGQVQRENSTFDVHITPRNYSAKLPSYFRVVLIGDLAANLTKGDYISVKCSTIAKAKEKAIGQLSLEYRDSPLIMNVSIVGVDKLDARIAKPIFDAIGAPTVVAVREAKGPLYDPTTMTRAEFLDNFYKIDGADRLGVSTVAKAEIFRYFGVPPQDGKINGERWWGFFCSDGKILLRMGEGFDSSLVPAGHFIVKAIEEVP